jgi:cell division protein FtsZ
VQGIAEIITLPGLINVDFADVKAIMANAGSALMGIGKASGENRAVDAAKQAIASPLLEISIDGAKGILFTVTGGPDLAMYEVAEAAKVITGSADDDARVIFGANIDETLGDEVRITVVATGFDNREVRRAPSLAGDVEIAPRSTWSPTPASRRDDFRGTTRMASPYESPFEARKVPSAPVPQEREAYQEPALPSRSGMANVIPSEPQFTRRTPQPAHDEYQQPAQQQQAPVPQPAQKTEDDDMGIPAFIRRKMM